MSKKRILNTTSTKKRDNMLCFTNSTSASQSGSATYSQSAAVVNGGISDASVAAFIWCATARQNAAAIGAPVTGKFAQSTRTATSCYMVGLSEKIEVQCNTGMPWQWRRVCFTMRGAYAVTPVTTPGSAIALAQLTSNGYVRVMNQIPGNPGQDPMYSFFVRLFRGDVSSDWNDPMTAPLDNTRLDIKYDKTVTLSSGNEDGFIRTYKRWHPMRKNLVYDDDESGGNMVASSFSVDGKAGMGDYYVVDLFRARQGSATTDQLTVRPEATLYWHEK